MKSNLTESLGKSLSENERQKDDLSSDLDNVVLRKKSTTCKQGIKSIRFTRSKI